MLQQNCMSEDWELLQTFFPKGWRELARTSGAIKGLRQDKDPAVLLRVLLLHVGCGYSLRETSARAKASGLCDLSDVSVLKRLNKSEAWLHALCGCLFGEVVNFGTDKTYALGKLRLIDGSLISEPGKTGSTWRLHYSMAWPSLLCDHFELTPAKGKGTGESLDRYPAAEGDHFLADRGFCNAKAIHGVCASGADVTVRLNPSNVRLFSRPKPGTSNDESSRERFDLLGFLKQLDTDWEAKSQKITMADGQDGSMVNGRICAIRKSEEAIAAALKKVTWKANKNGSKPKEVTKIYARYVMVFTTVEEEILDPTETMNLYRLRWQIELVFKRFKQMIDLGHLPKSDPQSSRSWLYGKMFSALLTEKLVATAERLSPWGYGLKGSDTKPLAGGEIHDSPTAKSD
jgi:hypothetical protein